MAYMNGKLTQFLYPTVYIALILPSVKLIMKIAQMYIISELII